jgi:hypothetical protein
MMHEKYGPDLFDDEGHYTSTEMFPNFWFFGKVSSKIWKVSENAINLFGSHPNNSLFGKITKIWKYSSKFVIIWNEYCLRQKYIQFPFPFWLRDSLWLIRTFF